MRDGKTYVVRNDCMEMQFTRKTEEGARRQLHMCAEAAPDVQCDLFVLDGGAWSWLSSMMSSECGSIEIGD